MVSSPKELKPKIMLFEILKYIFYIFCFLNAIVLVAFFIVHLIEIPVTVILVATGVTTTFSLLITGLAAWAVWESKKIIRWFLFACLVIMALSNFVEFIIRYNENINTHWEMSKTGEGSTNFIQQTLECCGKNGPDDFEKQNKTIPNSCYPAGSEGDEKKVYTTGCTIRWKQIQAHPVHLTIKFVLQSILATLLGLISSSCINKESLQNNSLHHIQGEINDST